jgi:hypothetical protein
MRQYLARAVLAAIFLAVSVHGGHCAELKTRYGTIHYGNEKLLRDFDGEVSLRSLSYLTRGKKNETVGDEVVNKVDIIVGRVEAVLEMFPKNLSLTVTLLPSEKEVQRIYREKYGVDVDYIAFYSPKDETIYISVNDARLGVLAHEVAHAVIDHYFGVSPPAKIHEVLSQFVESHLED